MFWVDKGFSIGFDTNRRQINFKFLTRMHSSRMRTVRCSGCGGCIPACTGQGGASQQALDRGCIPTCTGQEGVSPPCEQNHRRLWKHNLASTTLRTVKMFESMSWCSLKFLCQRVTVNFWYRIHGKKVYVIFFFRVFILCFIMILCPVCDTFLSENDEDKPSE